MPVDEGAVVEPTSLPLVFSEEQARKLLELIRSVEHRSLLRLSHQVYALLYKELTEDPAILLLGEAFSYTLNTEWGKSKFRTSLGPAVKSDNTWPDPVKNAPEAVISTWNYLYTHIDTPAIRARLADLLLSSEKRPVIKWARETVRCAVQALDDKAWNQRESYSLAMRALSICGQYRLLDLQAPIMSAVGSEIASVLASDDWLNRNFLGLLRAFKITVQSCRIAEYDELWTSLYRRVLDLIPGAVIDDFVAPDLCTVMDNQADLRNIQSRHVEQKIKEGDDADGTFRKKSHYDMAAKLARNYELTDLHKTAIKKLQRVPNDQSEWQTVVESVSVPRGAVEREIQRLTYSRDWQVSLETILLLPAPTGVHESNLKRARKLASEHPFRHLVTNVEVGVHGLFEKTRTSDADAVSADLQFVESTEARSQGRLVAMALMRIQDQHPDVRPEDVAIYLVEHHDADPALAQLLGLALSDFWHRNFEQAAMRLLFRIEGVARQLLILLDEPLYRVQAGEGRGKFPSLEFYIDALESRGFDPDWARTIRILLMSDGFNYRNLVGHGYAVRFGPIEAALIIRIFGILCLATPELGLDAKSLLTGEFSQRRANRAKLAEAQRRALHVLARHRRRRRSRRHR